MRVIVCHDRVDERVGSAGVCHIIKDGTDSLVEIGAKQDVGDVGGRIFDGHWASAAGSLECLSLCARE